MYRSFLFAPGNHARKVLKVFGCGADNVILDLEDAVAKAEIGQDFRGALDGLVALQPADHLRQHDVLERGEFRQ